MSAVIYHHRGRSMRRRRRVNRIAGRSGRSVPWSHAPSRDDHRWGPDRDLALAASATAPKPHEYTKAIDVNASYDAAWSAVVEVFADHNWVPSTSDNMLS